MTKEIIELSRAEIIDELWERGDLSYKLDDLQIRITITVNSLPQVKKVTILSSRQIGKSFWSCCFALVYLLKNPGKIARIVAPTLKQCADIVNDNLNPICRDAPDGLITPHKSTYRWELSNGSSLRLGALERAHVDGNRGGNASLVIYEECGFVNADDFTYGVNSVLGPQLLRSNGREIFVSSPSENPDHPLHTLLLPECEALGTAFRYSVFDSPSISPQMILEAMRRSGCAVTPQFQQYVIDGLITNDNIFEIAANTKTILSEDFLREFLAQIIRSVTLMIVPSYDPRHHVLNFRPPVECFWEITIDWGGVRDKTVALLHTHDFGNDTDLIADELVWPANTPTSEVVNDLKKDWEKQYPITNRWADVPGQLQVDLANQFEYDVHLPQKSDWKATINNMSVRFAQKKIKIHPKCVFLQKSLRAGMFNKTKTDFERSAELGHCDALAALMYAIRSQNKENPYEIKEPTMRDNVFIPVKSNNELEDVAKAFAPKRFGGFK